MFRNCEDVMWKRLCLSGLNPNDARVGLSKKNKLKDFLDSPTFSNPIPSGVLLGRRLWRRFERAGR